MIARAATTQFVLTGFTHETGFRVFAFECMGEDRAWIKSTVKADLTLARKYGIHIQELPLMCRAILDRAGQDGKSRMVIFTEEDMQNCASERDAAREAAKKRRPVNRPTGENVGSAWRTQHA